MNFFAVSGLLIGIAGIFEALLVFLKGRNKTHYLWGLFCLSFIVWGFGGYKVAIIANPQEAILWWRLTYVGVIFIPIFLIHFTLEFLSIKRRFLLCAIYFLGVLFLLADLFTDLFINNVRWVFNQFFYLSPPTWLYDCFVIFFFILVLSSVFKLGQAYITAKGVNRTQLKYIIISLIVGFGGGAFSFLPVYHIDFYPYLNLSISIGTILVAYAIFKYRFMDLRVLARKIFIYFWLAAFTYGIFYGIVWSYQEFFGGVFNSKSYLAGVFIAPIFIALVFFLIKGIEKIANRYFFSDLYNYQETINKLSDELTYYTDVSKITDAIVGTIKKTMQLDRAGVLLINEKIKPARYEITKIIGFDKQNSISLAQGSVLAGYLEKSRRPLVKEELSLLIKDTRQKKNKNDFQKIYDYLEHIEASLCLPLISGKKLIGLVVLGSKFSGDAYTAEDLNLLSTLANQAGIAISNARFYKEIHDFNQTLKQKVDEQTKEIKEKSKYLEELLNMKTDFLRVVNHQLNTPMSIMNGAFSMMGEKIYDTKKGLYVLKAAFERTNQTISDFWDAYELEGEKMKMAPAKTNLKEIVEKLVEEKQKLQLAQERKLKIEIKQPEFDIPTVWCDPKKIAHVVSNLLDNAVFYTEKGGVTVSFDAIARQLKVNVKDTGVGISAEDKKKLFQKFSRGQGATNLHPDGSGLGLYIAKKIVEGNDGELSYDSAGIGQGATFSFSLPIYQSQDKTVKGLKSSVEDDAGQRKRIEIFNTNI
ncbi:MAG: ATP-binding protein [Patescibacteria group bacterium]